MKLTTRPILHGTWHGTLASHWVNPATGKRINPDPNVFLVVRQRFWSISARLITRESKSESLLADLRADADGVCQFVYLYRNTPRTEVRHRSEIHYGSVVLTAPKDPIEALEGHYFADRHPDMTRGELTLTTRYPDIIETHAGGMKLVASPASEA